MAMKLPRSDTLLSFLVGIEESLKLCPASAAGDSWPCRLGMTCSRYRHHFCHPEESKDPWSHVLPDVLRGIPHGACTEPDRSVRHNVSEIGPIYWTSVADEII